MLISPLTALARFSRSAWQIRVLGALICLGLVGFFAARLSSTGESAARRSPTNLDSSTVQEVAERPESVAAPMDRSSWDERWERWLMRLASPGSDGDLALEFEAMVRADPARALTSAHTQPDGHRRSRLMQAVILLWTETDGDAAAAAARALPETDRAVAVAALLAGTAHQPEAAIRLATEFCRNDPSLASEHGYSLVTALGRSGAHEAAIRFALGADNPRADEDNSKWLKAAFAQWAEKNPAAALAAIQALPGGGAQFEALDAVVTCQVQIDAAAVAERLRQSPRGPERDRALGQALRAWVDHDVKAAAQWLNQLDPSPERDVGAAAIAVQPQVQAHPEIALSWAESIANREHRSRTLSGLVQQWAAADSNAALRYAQSSPHLSANDRADLLAKLQN